MFPGDRPAKRAEVPFSGQEALHVFRVPFSYFTDRQSHSMKRRESWRPLTHALVASPHPIRSALFQPLRFDLARLDRRIPLCVRWLLVPSLRLPTIRKEVRRLFTESFLPPPGLVRRPLIFACSRRNRAVLLQRLQRHVFLTCCAGALGRYAHFVRFFF